VPNRRFRRFEIDSLDDLREHIRGGHHLVDHVLHGIDLSSGPALDVDVENCLFLGCTFRDVDQQRDLEERGAYVFPEFADIPYNPYRHELYTSDELLSGYARGGYVRTLDFRVYTHFDRMRRRAGGAPIRESLAQRIHDHAIDDALYEFVDLHRGRGIVGIMGGHGTERTDPDYRKVVELCRDLTRRGYLVATGGGPGIMEAGNLGAYTANFDDDRIVDAALEILAQAPKFDGGEDEGTPEYMDAIQRYLAAGYEAREALRSDEFARDYGRRRPDVPKSLAIPTWFYGHEPTNLFCDHVAKYFSNGLREDVLLAIAKAGVVFAPGSAGTLQEIFMDLAQNHYATFVERSPMVFLDSDRFHEVYALIRGFIERRDKTDVYGDLVAMFDEPKDVADFIESNPPRPRRKTAALYDLV
jgi:predicted Rossmann-fold nucleotide-binding protein